MRATRLQLIALTAGAMILGLSRVGGLPADISAIALNPSALMQSESRFGEGSAKFHGGEVRPINKTM